MGRRKNSNKGKANASMTDEEMLLQNMLGHLLDPTMLAEIANMRTAVDEKISADHILHLMQDHSYLIEGDNDAVYLRLDDTHYLQIDLADIYVEEITGTDNVVPFKICDPVPES